jgi:hypothetical protein
VRHSSSGYVALSSGRGDHYLDYDQNHLDHDDNHPGCDDPHPKHNDQYQSLAGDEG